MKECNCYNFKLYVKRMKSIAKTYKIEIEVLNFFTKGCKMFSFCPYCGKELKEDK